MPFTYLATGDDRSGRGGAQEHAEKRERDAASYRDHGNPLGSGLRDCGWLTRSASVDDPKGLESRSTTSTTLANTSLGMCTSTVHLCPPPVCPRDRRPGVRQVHAGVPAAHGGSEVASPLGSPEGREQSTRLSQQQIGNPHRSPGPTGFADRLEHDEGMGLDSAPPAAIPGSIGGRRSRSIGGEHPAIVRVAGYVTLSPEGGFS
jgi:hypothetical protein